MVDGLDVERTEKGEMESFRRALAAPERERDIELRDRHGNPINARDFLAVIFAIANVLFATICAGGIADCAQRAGSRLPGSVVIGLFVFFFAMPLSLYVWRRLRSMTAARSTKVRDRFTLTLDASGLGVSSSARRQHTPRQDIARFEDDGRLVLVATDGTRTRLPFALDTRTDTAALADRLNDALREVRAGGGYRGTEPARVRVDASEDASAEVHHDPTEDQRSEGASSPRR